MSGVAFKGPFLAEWDMEAQASTTQLRTELTLAVVVSTAEENRNKLMRASRKKRDWLACALTSFCDSYAANRCLFDYVTGGSTL
jgi:hypothetical protein